MRIKSSALFADGVFPSGPFLRPGWIAVAFDRDVYDVMRMPRHFFDALEKHFGRGGREELCIEPFSESPSAEGALSRFCVPFRWDEIRRILLSEGDFSVEFKAFTKSRSFAVWADPDMTLVGGEAESMDSALGALGGRQGALEHMRKEFLLGEPSNSEEMDSLFRNLIQVSGMTGPGLSS